MVSGTNLVWTAGILRATIITMQISLYCLLLLTERSDVVPRRIRFPNKERHRVLYDNLLDEVTGVPDRCTLMMILELGFNSLSIYSTRPSKM